MWSFRRWAWVISRARNSTTCSTASMRRWKKVWSTRSASAWEAVPTAGISAPGPQRNTANASPPRWCSSASRTRSPSATQRIFRGRIITCIGAYGPMRISTRCTIAAR
ncbi:MAG: hypothetical protein MZV64_14875 [Ignavibacteriales bacterium]|nr:hypothetical protein [Ignavibacteriales bacterium]